MTSGHWSVQSTCIHLKAGWVSLVFILSTEQCDVQKHVCLKICEVHSWLLIRKTPRKSAKYQSIYQDTDKISLPLLEAWMINHLLSCSSFTEPINISSVLGFLIPYEPWQTKAKLISLAFLKSDHENKNKSESKINYSNAAILCYK